MLMYKINAEQKLLLDNKLYNATSKFNPIEDIHGDWYISQQEVNSNMFSWLNELQSSEFVPKPQQIDNTFNPTV